MNPFSSSEFAEIGGLSGRSAVRMLSEAVGAGMVERVGRGRAARYRVLGAGEAVRAS